MISVPELDGDVYLRVAERIAQDIGAQAVWHDNRCNWVGAIPEEAPGGRIRMTFRALGPDLYGGTAGVGLFLAELAAITQDKDCRRTAEGALRHAILHVDDLPQVTRLGLYAGRPGVALALALASRALDEPELDAASRAIAATVPEPEPGDELDLMAGRAGAIVGLLALKALTGDEGLLGTAIAQADALVAAGERTDSGVCWRSPGSPANPALAGFSHGAAGVAVALLELADATGTAAYRDAAVAGFAYERALYEPAACNWPDLRADPRHPAGSRPRFVTLWCHGAPGEALARLRALELGGETTLRDEAAAALGTTEAWAVAAIASGAANYSLCHGLTGNAEVLLEGSAIQPSAQATAYQAALAGIEAYHERRQPWPSGAQGRPTPCLFLGLAGIGRFYLRLARPGLPSLLLVRPAANWTVPT